MIERFAFAQGPQRIVCMTEETTEWLYLLGEEQRIVGISGYTARPPRETPRERLHQRQDRQDSGSEARLCLRFFRHAGRHRGGADSPRRAGHGVQPAQRGRDFSMMYQVAAMVGQAERGLALIGGMQHQLATIANAAASLPRRPKIFFEEWDTPHISAIRWVSELMGIAGGDDCFPELAAQSLGKNRIIADSDEIVRRNPDIIVGSWCGKKFRPENVAARPGWDKVNAVKHQQLFEIKSADILQPGPAALTDGVAQLHRVVMDCSRNVAPTLATSSAALPGGARDEK